MSSALSVAPAVSGLAANSVEDWREIERVFRGMVARNTTEAEIDAAIMVCKANGFNPVLNHINLIDGKVYVTHKGLWNLAHRSGQLDGIEILEQGETDTHHIARVAIYRKDMRYAFTYWGRYSKQGRNKQYGPEMAVTRAECMALRRAFDVSMPIYEEINWEREEAAARPAVTVVEERQAQLPAQAPKRAWTRDETLAWLGKEERSIPDQERALGYLFGLTDDQAALEASRQLAESIVHQDALDVAWHDRMEELERISPDGNTTAPVGGAILGESRSVGTVLAVDGR